MARTNAHQMRESCSANLSYHRKFSSLSLRRQFFHQTRTEIGLGKLRIWCCELNLAFILFKWYYTLTFLLFAIIGSDYSTQLQASAMISKLYKLCVKASQRADGSIDLCNEDAIAYARWVCICVSSIIFWLPSWLNLNVLSTALTKMLWIFRNMAGTYTYRNTFTKIYPKDVGI